MTATTDMSIKGGFRKGETWRRVECRSSFDWVRQSLRI